LKCTTRMKITMNRTGKNKGRAIIFYGKNCLHRSVKSRLFRRYCEGTGKGNRKKDKEREKQFEGEMKQVKESEVKAKRQKNTMQINKNWRKNEKDVEARTVRRTKLMIDSKCEWKRGEFVKTRKRKETSEERRTNLNSRINLNIIQNINIWVAISRLIEIP